MNEKNKPPIGIIAEDDSDFLSARMLIKRISANNKLTAHKFLGKGCGKIKKKCNAWAKVLNKKGCGTLVLIHDSDTNNPDRLRTELKIALSPCPIQNHLICIPIQEFEAWFLSDPDAIKSGLKLRKAPSIKGLPEQIDSPKEFLGELVHRTSNGEKIYINTKHNEKISQFLSIKKVLNRCPSFSSFYCFIRKHLSN